AELRLGARADGQRAQGQGEGQSLVERAQDARERLADVDLVAAVAGPDLVLPGHERARGADALPDEVARRGGGHAPPSFPARGELVKRRRPRAKLARRGARGRAARGVRGCTLRAARPLATKSGEADCPWARYNAAIVTEGGARDRETAALRHQGGPDGRLV